MWFWGRSYKFFSCSIEFKALELAFSFSDHEINKEIVIYCIGSRWYIHKMENAVTVLAEFNSQIINQKAHGRIIAE